MTPASDLFDTIPSSNLPPGARVAGRIAGLVLTLVFVVILPMSAIAQDAENASDSEQADNDAAENTEEMDEITVRGARSLVAIERQMQRADQQLYGLSNALIEDPLYKVHCLRESTAGSNIKKRVCRPGFERELASDAWEDEKLMGRQGGNRFTFDYKLPEAELRKHRDIFKQKLVALAAENPELAEAILARAKLQRDYAEERQRQLGE